MIYSKEELQAIGDWAVEHDILILADDIYGRLVYNGNTFTPISSLSDAIRKQTIVINGVSKTYAMTGWRVGFAVGDPEIISGMAKIISQTTSNLTAVSQYAAIEALTGDQSSIEEMRQAFEERLNTIYPSRMKCLVLKSSNLKVPFTSSLMLKKRWKSKATNVNDFTNAILKRLKVALVTGAGFGAPENIRLSLCNRLRYFERSSPSNQTLYGKK